MPVTSTSSAFFKFVYATSQKTASSQPCRQSIRRIATGAKPSEKRKMQTSTYQSYTFDPHAHMPPPRNAGAPETSISAGIPQFHDTRPPQNPEQMYQKPAVAVPEKEAQKSQAPARAAAPAPGTASLSEAAPAVKPRSRLRARKAAIKLSPTAVEALRDLLNQPDPKLIKVGVKNRGCSGLAYNLEYVDKPGKFDEMVEQDGVKVLIDSKALFSIIGSEMDWVEDKLNQKFVFHNPNISEYSYAGDTLEHKLTSTSEEQCGCGESFMV